MRYHLCCNQLKHCWEVMDSANTVVFTGSKDEASKYIEKLLQ